MDTNVVMVSVGILYFVGDSIKPFQSQNKHHNINPPPSPTYPPHHPTPHAFIASSETETNDIASHRIASHLQPPYQSTEKSKNNTSANTYSLRLFPVSKQSSYHHHSQTVLCFFFHFLKMLLTTVPGKSAGDKNRPWLSFLHFVNKGLYYCEDEGRGSCFVLLEGSYLVLYSCSLC